jgi:ribonucleotide monophosphatase NagD (HAD superfamily)
MEKLLQYVRRTVPSCAGIFRPIVITDIDGVLLRGSVQIPGTLEAVKKLQASGIPLACLTNGGGYLERIKAKKMNDIFGESLFKD